MRVVSMTVCGTLALGVSTGARAQALTPYQISYGTLTFRNSNCYSGQLVRTARLVSDSAGNITITAAEIDLDVVNARGISLAGVDSYSVNRTFLSLGFAPFPTEVSTPNTFTGSWSGSFQKNTSGYTQISISRAYRSNSTGVTCSDTINGLLVPVPPGL